MDLKDKVAVVTGAAQGLGKSFVNILLKNGAKVAIIDMNESLGKELKVALAKNYGSDRAEFYAADITSEQEFKGVFKNILEKFGHIDIFCNNAGIINENDWEKTVALNLNAVVRGTYLALEHMKKDNGGNGGVIVNVGSMAGLGPMPSAPIYTATKYGVVGFSRALAAVSNLAGYGVRINILCPCFVRTNLLSSLSSEQHVGRFLQLKGLTEMAMEKYGILEADDVAKAFLILVADESKNGEALMMDSDGAAFVSLPKRAREHSTTAVSLE